MHNLKQHIFLVFALITLYPVISVAAAFEPAMHVEPLEFAERGITAMNEGRHSEGMSHFGYVYSAGDPDALNEVGSWYAGKGETVLAIDFFNKSAEIDGFPFDRAVAMNNLGTLRIKLQQFSEAKRNLKQAHAFFSSLINDDEAKKFASMILHNLGCLYIKKSDKVDKGLDYLHQSADGTDCVETIYAVACALLEGGRLNAAKSLLYRITEMGAPPVIISDVANNLGIICYQQNDLQWAEIYFERSAGLGNPIGSDNLRLLRNAVGEQSIR